VGRKKLWTERLHLTLPKGAKERIRAVLMPGEDSLDLVRKAVETEVSARERAKEKDRRS